MLLSDISVSVYPEPFGQPLDEPGRVLMQYCHHVADEYLWHLWQGSGGKIRTKSMGKLCVETRHDAALHPHGLAIDVYMYPVLRCSILDLETRPSRRRIAETIRDGLLACADEQGISKELILAAYEAFDFSVDYWGIRWDLKVIGAKASLPQLWAYSRVNGTHARIYGIVGDSPDARYFLLVDSDSLDYYHWSALLGDIKWENSETFTLRDKKRNFVARQSLREKGASFEELP